MKIRFLQFIISGLLVSAGLTACNSASTSDTASATSTAASASTMVTSFNLKINNKLLQNLDSVFFSIDQAKAQIFNADSLPWGTDVRKLQVVIGAPSSAKAVEIIMPRLSDGQDTIVNYLTNPNDSINFSRGNVWLRVSSPSGDEERVYNIKVNVHECNADSLQWNTDKIALPSSLTSAAAARALEFDGKYYCYTADAAGNRQVSVTVDPLSVASVATIEAVSADIDVNTVVATSNALYALSASTPGDLMTSTDGIAWSSTGSTGWTWLYGGYDDQLIGAKQTRWEAYPSGRSGAIPAGMPVEATSQMWTYTDEWFISPQAIIAGGLTANGTPTGAAWGFDGTGWGQLSGLKALPDVCGMTLFPYFTYRTEGKKFYVVDRHSCWIALGGIDPASGKVNDNVYVSLDNGVNWLTASESLQLPEEIKPRHSASALLATRQINSRAVKPITEWDAPYVLLYGGLDASGALYNQVWIGVINRLTFKPLQ